MMVPYKLIDTGASFATAMTQVGFGWASYVVSLGALLGIVTGVLANIMGVSRILCSLARTHLAPPALGRVSRRFRTPFNATVLLVIVALPLTVLSDLPTLIDMVSAGTLMVFAVVALALLWHRYADSKAPIADNAKPAAGISLLVAAGISERRVLDARWGSRMRERRSAATAPLVLAAVSCLRPRPAPAARRCT